MDAIRSHFPNGYERMETGGQGLLCGLSALRLSFQHQSPTLPPSSIHELYRIATEGFPTRKDTVIQDRTVKECQHRFSLADGQNSTLTAKGMNPIAGTLGATAREYAATTAGQYN